VPCIHWLHDCTDPVAAGLGGKGASLVRLQNAGFLVPPGFVVGADGYQEWLNHNDLLPELGTILAVPNLRLPKIAREASAPLRAKLDATQLPEWVCSEVLDAYERLRELTGRDPVVAVRSSALSEDGDTSSSAGLYETYLNIRTPDAVLESLSRCYRSLWSSRAIQYRAFKNIDSRLEAMAVVVMEMVPAEVSGVAFTVNPVTSNSDEIVINATWGLGEALVSGRVTPDSFVVRKADLAVTSREVYEKELMVLPDPSGASGTISAEVPAEQRSLRSLSDEDVRRVAHTCARIEEHHGCAQDVEWAFHAGQIYVLQSRPVTALR
jgi:pyruvate,water dikinase